ncbi:MAG: endonuclease/exonuclease/phosphatase family protein [Pseudomonadota bacterium]|nr:endonuclease/exonuclease/phosphatase family protein [Pseudomonadota bacterium]
MKLVTWNTQWCCGLDGSVSPQRIVDGARAMADFDVLCLQEIAQGYGGMPGGPGDQPAQLRALLPGFQCFYGAAVEEFDAEGRPRRFGNLIATRLPVARVQHHLLPWPADAGVRSMPRMCTVLTLRHPELGWIRVMTTHLEYYSAVQRMAQARALRAIHFEAVAQAHAPPMADTGASPFQARPHTPHAILCGDFNLGIAEPEYTEIQRPCGESRLQDAWPLVHGSAAHAATFRLFDRTYGPEPVACDFIFVSDTLTPHVKQVEVDLQTRASDHQPVLVSLSGQR